MSVELTRTVTLTDEELNEVEEPGDLIVERLREAARKLNEFVTPEMEDRGMDLKITMEVLPR